MNLNPSLIRAQFPALARKAIYFDNPGGTQIAQQSLDRMVDYLLHHNSNHGGVFATTKESDAILDEAHAAAADFLNASPDEIVFGANMTTLTLHLSRSISREWKEGDRIAVTRLDHDANISPWMLAARDRGVELLWVDFDVEEGTLDLRSLQAALDLKPKMLAVGYASNALGTINPVQKIIQMAHAASTQVYIDAVQYAPHGSIDVRELDCDYLVCSSYKFFGPHAGMLYGKAEHLERLQAYKVRPATNQGPGKWETGTQNHEGIAGLLGALEYFEWLGKNFGGDGDSGAGAQPNRRKNLLKGMKAIQDYELVISRRLLETLKSIPGLRLYGLQDESRLAERVPTYVFTLPGMHPHQVAEKLAEKDIYVWDGNYYALAVTERLGLEGKGGMVRVGPVHYNTVEEIDTLGEVLNEIVRE